MTTVKILLKTHKPGDNPVHNYECEFTRVPTVGEHIWQVMGSNYNTLGCYKVVYVAHIPVFTILSQKNLEYSAQIYAVEVDIDELTDIEFFRNQNIQPL